MDESKPGKEQTDVNNFPRKSWAHIASIPDTHPVSYCARTRGGALRVVLLSCYHHRVVCQRPSSFLPRTPHKMISLHEASLTRSTAALWRKPRSLYRLTRGVKTQAQYDFSKRDNSGAETEYMSTASVATPRQVCASHTGNFGSGLNSH